MRAGLAAGGAAAGTAAIHLLPAPAAHVPALARALGVPLRHPGLGGVALTFDDGPHPEATLSVLEILREHGARATFFLVGEQVRRTGSLAQEIAAAGHGIAVHGDTHRPLWRLTTRQLREDLDRASDTLGSHLALHRAPYGAYSLAALRAVRRRGWQPLLWSRWGRDWAASARAEDVAARATRDLSDGDVVLLHDADQYSDAGAWRTTVAALPQILERIDAAGLTTRVL